MTKPKRSTIVFVGSVCGTILALGAHNARAVPSFARQTGLSCSVCHTVFPELTPFGRAFKLNGYVLSKIRKPYPASPPIAGMAQASFSHTNTRQPPDQVHNQWSSTFLSRGNNDLSIPQQLSAFYGGKIFDKVGALVQGTYDGSAETLFLDNSDVRFADLIHVDGKSLVYGVDMNNGPTVGDLWNTTPAWGFPYASSFVAPTPAAATLIDGGLGQQVGGIGAYTYWNHLLYVQANVYRTALDGITEFFGAGTPTDTVVEGAVPYWRIALQHRWGPHTLEFGTYGLVAHAYPGGYTHGPTDRFTDLALDAEYEYIAGNHIFTVETTWIHEKQNWNASYALGTSANPTDTLQTYRIDANYYYRSSYGTFGGTVGYFNTFGDKDALLYSPAPVVGSRTGSPDSDGFILQADYLPWQNIKFLLQYTIYNRFNGSSSNYDGFGRSASDNDTLYLAAWMPF